jgi:hypothetical protein
MQVIELSEDEYSKVFDEILDFGPITHLPGNLTVVNRLHLRFLNEQGVRYKRKDWKDVAKERKRWEAAARRKHSEARQG